MNKESLKYLFTATYKDGRVYQQNAEDKSLTEPETRSCFFDIKDDIEKLESFVLKGDGHEYGVDLTDGHFEIDGIPFFMHEGHVVELENGKKILIPLKDFKLIFFRQHTRSYEVALYKEEQKEIAHTVIYRMGWQCTVNEGTEENPKYVDVQRVMQFA